MCECFQIIGKQIADRFPKAHVEFVAPPMGFVNNNGENIPMYLLPFEVKLKTGRRVKSQMIAMKYCPFCGEPFEEFSNLKPPERHAD